MSIYVHPNIQPSSEPTPISHTGVVVSAPDPIALTSTDVECLAKNIYFEARGENIKGQLAVGLVTINRMKDERWPDDVCGVVYQNKQFSWYWDGKSDEPTNTPVYNKIVLIASTLLDADNFPAL